MKEKKKERSLPGGWNVQLHNLNMRPRWHVRIRLLDDDGGDRLFRTSLPLSRTWPGFDTYEDALRWYEDDDNVLWLALRLDMSREEEP